MRRTCMAYPLIVVSMIAFSLLPTVAGASGSGIPQWVTAKIDPGILSTDNDSIEVLVVARPIQPEALQGLPKQDAVKLLKTWAASILEGVTDEVRRLGGSVVNEFWVIPALVARIPPSAALKLAADPRVVEVILNTEKFHVDGAIGQSATPSSLRDGVVVNWGVEALNVTAAWKLGYTGLGVKVAVLDTGVDPTHPALLGKLFTLVPGDPTYPGGWIEFDSEGKPLCTSAHDSAKHGTFVSSLVAGGDVNETLVGVAPEATLLEALVLPGGSGTPAQVLAGFQWALQPYLCNGTPAGVTPNVVLFSAGWEGYTGSFLLDVIREMLELGMVIVSSIGNYGYGVTTYPANVWGVYGVGAVNESMGVPDFSGGGVVAWANPPSDWPFKPPYPTHYIKPDFAAPGVNVGGAVPGGAYAYGNGTSYAAAEVAGLAALVIQALNATNGESPLENYTLPELVYDIIKNTSADMGAPGQDTRYGWGVPNAGEAVELAVRIAQRIPVRVDVNATRVVVGEKLNVTILPHQGAQAPPEGAVFLVYLDSRPVGRAVFKAGRASAVITVPEAPGGQHVIEVRSLAGFRGKATIYVEPSITLAPPRASAGRSVLLEVHGHSPNSTYIVLLDGYQASRVITGPLGNGSTGLPIPANALPGAHVVETVTPSGEPVAEARVYVTVTEELRVQVAAASWYEGRATIYILVLLKGEPVDANLTVSMITPKGSTETLKPERLQRGLYAVRFTPNTSIALVLVNASLEAESLSAHGASAVIIKTSNVTGHIEALAADLEDLGENVSLIARGVSGLNETIASMSKNLSAALHSLNELRSSMQTLNETLQNITRELEGATGTLASELESINSSLGKVLSTLEALNSSIAFSKQDVVALIRSVNTSVSALVRNESQRLRLFVEEEGVSTRENVTLEIRSVKGILSRLSEEVGGYYKSLSTQVAEARSTILASLKEVEESLVAVKSALNNVAGTLSKISGGLVELERNLKEDYESLTSLLSSIEDKLASLERLLHKTPLCHTTSSTASPGQTGGSAQASPPSTYNATKPPTQSMAAKSRTSTTLEVAAAAAASAAVLILIYTRIILRRHPLGQ